VNLKGGEYFLCTLLSKAVYVLQVNMSSQLCETTVSFLMQMNTIYLTLDHTIRISFLVDQKWERIFEACNYGLTRLKQQFWAFELIDQRRENKFCLNEDFTMTEHIWDLILGCYSRYRTLECAHGLSYGIKSILTKGIVLQPDALYPDVSQRSKKRSKSGIVWLSHFKRAVNFLACALDVLIKTAHLPSIA